MIGQRIKQARIAVTQDLAVFDENVGAMGAQSLLRLPASERDALMEQAAAAVADEYEDGGALSGLESLSWEDHFDAPLDDELAAGSQ